MGASLPPVGPHSPYGLLLCAGTCGGLYTGPQWAGPWPLRATGLEAPQCCLEASHRSGNALSMVALVAQPGSGAHGCRRRVRTPQWGDSRVRAGFHCVLPRAECWVSLRPCLFNTCLLHKASRSHIKTREYGLSAFTLCRTPGQEADGFLHSPPADPGSL